MAPWTWRNNRKLHDSMQDELKGLEARLESSIGQFFQQQLAEERSRVEGRLIEGSTKLQQQVLELGASLDLRATTAVSQVLEDALPVAMQQSLPQLVQEPAQSALFEWLLLSAARTLCADQDFRTLLPTRKPPAPMEQLRIGFFGNIANNHYNIARCLRKLGYQAELVIEDAFMDAFLLNRPFWEDVEVECDCYEDGLAFESAWQPPAFVRRVSYDPYLHNRYACRLSGAAEVREIYQKEFDIELPLDKALLLAQNMGHWPYIRAMKRYDLVQFSGAAMQVAMFCPRPYFVFPTGSDLFISPFQESMLGFLMRYAYRNATGIAIAEINYPQYLDRLIPRHLPRHFSPILVDTDTYSAQAASELRAKWHEQIGGKLFVLCICRQAWEWKGNDIILRAFAKCRNPDARLILMRWGPDVQKSEDLIQDLNIRSHVCWEKLCSKPRLRQRINAADIVVDQVVMPGYGTSVLEAMSLEKPVAMRFERTENTRFFEHLPPLIPITREDDLSLVIDAPQDLVDVGKRSREWVLRFHGYDQNARRLLDFYVECLS